MSANSPDSFLFEQELDAEEETPSTPTVVVDLAMWPGVSALPAPPMFPALGARMRVPPVTSSDRFEEEPPTAKGPRPSNHPTLRVGTLQSFALSRGQRPSARPTAPPPKSRPRPLS